MSSANGYTKLPACTSCADENRHLEVQNMSTYFIFVLRIQISVSNIYFLRLNLLLVCMGMHLVYGESLTRFTLSSPFRRAA